MKALSSKKVEKLSAPAVAEKYINETREYILGAMMLGATPEEALNRAVLLINTAAQKNYTPAKWRQVESIQRVFSIVLVMAAYPEGQQLLQKMLQEKGEPK